MTWLLAALVVLWVAFGPWVVALAAVLLSVPRVRWWVLDRVHVTRRGTGLAVLVALAVTAVVLVVPDGRLPVPSSPGLLAVPSYVGRPAQARPVRAGEVPQHPHLAANGRGSVHNDAWASNAYTVAGPVGLQPEVETAWFGVEECASIMVDSAGRLVTLCEDRSGPVLHVVDPATMRKRASMDLPDRPDGVDRDLCATSGYLDSRDRAVLATMDRRVLAVTTADGAGEPGLTTEEEWDLKPYVPHRDCLVALLPDWSGRIWWQSRAGLVGTIAPETGEVRVHDLGEAVHNSITTDEGGGVYVVSEKALHRLTAGPDGTPQVTWRAAYDRGEERKPGQLSRGSGTTPTLLDGGVVAITDNAEPRMNVVFLRRDTGEELCRTPVFEKGASATEASLVSLGDAVVVENNHGARTPLGTALGFATDPGVARVDLDGSECSTRWTSDVAAPTSTAKVSWANGLVYAYSKRPSWTGVSAWYVTAIDAETGRVKWSARTGVGRQFGNRGAAITLAPDSSLWIATRAGLVRLRDRS